MRYVRKVVPRIGNSRQGNNSRRGRSMKTNTASLRFPRIPISGSAPLWLLETLSNPSEVDVIPLAALATISTCAPIRELLKCTFAKVDIGLAVDTSIPEPDLAQKSFVPEVALLSASLH